jgi:hypothetical protein
MPSACSISGGLPDARRPPLPATPAVQIAAPAARHAELFAGEASAAEGAQQGLHLAAQMGAHAHPLFSETAQKRFGQRGTEQHIHMEFGHTSRESVRRQRAEQYFPPPHFRAPSQRDDEQPRRGVEQGRYTLLPDGKSYSHNWTLGRRHASHLRTRRTL